MKRFALIFLLAVTASAQFGPVAHRRAAAQGGGTWADTNYAKRVTITIPSSQIGSTLTDQPVDIDLANAPADLFSNIESDGDDIRFYKDDHATLLTHELVRIDTGAQTGYAHVLHPSLSPSVDTVIVCYYDYASATAPANPQDVFDATGGDYLAVWHLDAAGDVAQPSATGQSDIDADPYNMESGDSVAGKMGNCITFDGVNEYYSVPATDANNHLNLDTTWSFSLWLLADDFNDRMIFERGDSTTSGIGAWNWGGGFFRPIAGDGTSTVYTNLTETESGKSTGTWYHMAATGDGVTARLYWDGTEVDSVTFAGDIVDTSDFRIGKWSALWKGDIDELRLSTNAWTADKISFEYSLQNDNTQLTWGTPESQ